MTTKSSSWNMYRGIYDSPYDAFTNYMNILGDFINRVNGMYPRDIDNEELNSLLTLIKNQGEELEVKDKEIARLNARMKKLVPEEGEPKKASTRKSSAKK